MVKPNTKLYAVPAPCVPHAVSALATVAQFLSLGPVEVWRYNGSGGGFEGPYDTSYPGWDPLGLTEDPDTFAELKVGAQAGYLALVHNNNFIIAVPGDPAGFAVHLAVTCNAGEAVAGTAAWLRLHGFCLRLLLHCTLHCKQPRRQGATDTASCTAGCTVRDAGTHVECSKEAMQVHIATAMATRVGCKLGEQRHLQTGEETGYMCRGNAVAGCWLNRVCNRCFGCEEVQAVRLLGGHSQNECSEERATGVGCTLNTPCQCTAPWLPPMVGQQRTLGLRGPGQVDRQGLLSRGRRHCSSGVAFEQ